MEIGVRHSCSPIFLQNTDYAQSFLRSFGKNYETLLGCRPNDTGCRRMRRRRLRLQMLLIRRWVRSLFRLGRTSPAAPRSATGLHGSPKVLEAWGGGSVTLPLSVTTSDGDGCNRLLSGGLVAPPTMGGTMTPSSTMTGGDMPSLQSQIQTRILASLEKHFFRAVDSIVLECSALVSTARKGQRRRLLRDLEDDREWDVPTPPTSAPIALLATEPGGEDNGNLATPSATRVVVINRAGPSSLVPFDILTTDLGGDVNRTPGAPPNQVELVEERAAPNPQSAVPFALLDRAPGEEDSGGLPDEVVPVAEWVAPDQLSSEVLWLLPSVEAEYGVVNAAVKETPAKEVVLTEERVTPDPPSMCHLHLPPALITGGAHMTSGPVSRFLGPVPPLLPALPTRRWLLWRRPPRRNGRPLPSSGTSRKRLRRCCRYRSCFRAHHCGRLLSLVPAGAGHRLPKGRDEDALLGSHLGDAHPLRGHQHLKTAGFETESGVLFWGDQTIYFYWT